MLEGRNLWELVEQRAEASPDSPDDRRRARPLDDVRRVPRRRRAGGRRAGRARGRRRRRRVVVLPTWHESLVLAGALCRLGAVQNPIIPIYRDREVGFCTGQAGTSLLLVPGTWRNFDFEAMGHRIARRSRAGPAGRASATTSCPTRDPGTLAPARGRPPAATTRRSAGSSTRRAPPPIRRERGIPTAT